MKVSTALGEAVCQYLFTLKMHVSFDLAVSLLGI